MEANPRHDKAYTITLYIVGWVIKGIKVGWVILKVIAPQRLGWPDTPLSLASGTALPLYFREHSGAVKEEEVTHKSPVSSTRSRINNKGKTNI